MAARCGLDWGTLVLFQHAKGWNILEKWNNKKRILGYMNLCEVESQGGWERAGAEGIRRNGPSTMDTTIFNSCSRDAL